MRDSQPYNFFRFTSKSDLQPLQKIQCLTLYKIGSELTISSCQNLTTVTVFGVKLHNISLKAKCSIIKYKSLAARLPKLFRSTLILPFLHSNYSTYNFSPFTHLSSFCSEFSLGGWLTFSPSKEDAHPLASLLEMEALQFIAWDACETSTSVSFPPIWYFTLIHLSYLRWMWIKRLFCGNQRKRQTKTNEYKLYFDHVYT